MKILLIALSITAPCFSAHAGPTIRLSGLLIEVENALNQGAGVSVAVDLSNCAPTGTTPAPGTTRGVLRINASRITRDGTLSFADEHATVDASGQPIWQFSYHIKADLTGAFSTDLLSLPTYNRIALRISYTCAIDQGIAFSTEQN
ncbi:VirK family protein [Burkholderia cenocepacia]|uniref:VirK family protein n=1 Tax=Burkholderia cenocepacia TaxID=95486 RepID=UPI00222F24E1|nr:VirK family protein [Burkholderia cenocepacia]MCW3610631.1 VirK family protein [Burkholderia cenocepacia]MCW5191709.1 VirK family protein [Burkholderia cenocepacia]